MSDDWQSLVTQRSQWGSTTVWLNWLTLVLLEIFCCKWQKLTFDQLKPDEEINGSCYQITRRVGVWPWRLLEPWMPLVSDCCQSSVLCLIFIDTHSLWHWHQNMRSFWINLPLWFCHQTERGSHLLVHIREKINDDTGPRLWTVSWHTMMEFSSFKDVPDETCGLGGMPVRLCQFPLLQS